MRNSIKILFALLPMCLVGSCENWRETAGDIAGMWQLTEWRDASNNVIATKEAGLYYCFQLNLLKFQVANQGEHHLSYYTHTHDSLFLGKTIYWPGDSVCQHSDLAKFGVPADGRLRIDVLNDDKLQLSSAQGTLLFRRY